MDDPEHCDAADGIRGNAPRPSGLRQVTPPHDSPREGNDEEDGCDEPKLSKLDADVEEEQRDGNRRLGQTDFAQCTSEAEAVEQAKGERNDRGKSLR